MQCAPTGLTTAAMPQKYTCPMARRGALRVPSLDVTDGQASARKRAHAMRPYGSHSVRLIGYLPGDSMTTGHRVCYKTGQSGAVTNEKGLQRCKPEGFW